MSARLVGKIWCVSFVTVAEMTQWARLRDWAQHNQAALDRWLSAQVFLDCGVETARTWGHLSANGNEAAADLRDLALVLARSVTDPGTRISFDDVLAAFGHTRESLTALPDDE